MSNPTSHRANSSTTISSSSNNLSRDNQQLPPAYSSFDQSATATFGNSSPHTDNTSPSTPSTLHTLNNNTAPNNNSSTTSTPNGTNHFDSLDNVFIDTFLRSRGSQRQPLLEEEHANDNFLDVLFDEVCGPVDDDSSHIGHDNDHDDDDRRHTNNNSVSDNAILPDYQDLATGYFGTGGGSASSASYYNPMTSTSTPAPAAPRRTNAPPPKYVPPSFEFAGAQAGASLRGNQQGHQQQQQLPQTSATLTLGKGMTLQQQQQQQQKQQQQIHTPSSPLVSSPPVTATSATTTTTTTTTTTPIPSSTLQSQSPNLTNSFAKDFDEFQIESFPMQDSLPGSLTPSHSTSHHYSQQPLSLSSSTTSTQQSSIPSNSHVHTPSMSTTTPTPTHTSPAPLGSVRMLRPLRTTSTTSATTTTTTTPSPSTSKATTTSTSAFTTSTTSTTPRVPTTTTSTTAMTTTTTSTTARVSPSSPNTHPSGPPDPRNPHLTHTINSYLLAGSIIPPADDFECPICCESFCMDIFNHTLSTMHRCPYQRDEFCQECPGLQLCECLHEFCIPCLQEYLQRYLVDVTALAQSLPRDDKRIPCPRYRECKGHLSVRELLVLLSPTEYSKLEQAQLKQAMLQQRAELWACPTPGCGHVQWLDPNVVYTVADCEKCHKSFCQTCKKPAHPGLTCQESERPPQLAVAPELPSRPSQSTSSTSSAAVGLTESQKARYQRVLFSNAPTSTSSAASSSQQRQQPQQQQQRPSVPPRASATNSTPALRHARDFDPNSSSIRKCPSCGNYIDKIEGCDKVKCLCGYGFCWKCGSPGATCSCTGRNHVFWDNATQSATRQIHTTKK